MSEESKISEGKVELTGLLDAVEEVHSRGKTALLLDNAEGTVETFYSYGNGIMVDAKAIALAGLRGSSTESEREKARGRIVDAMKNGGHLVIACSNSAPSFKSKIFEETSFPEELFDAVEITKKEVYRKLTRPAGEETSANYFPGTGSDGLVIHDTFRVVLLSKFERGDIEDFMGEELDLSKFEIIEVVNKS